MSLPAGVPLLIISPHLDDAVISCTALMLRNPGATVVNVFSGQPSNAVRLGEWDRRCGFLSAAQAIETRRKEDAHALHLVNAQSINLGFTDHQYGQVLDTDELTDALHVVMSKRYKSTAVIPLGLHHPDHVAAADAAFRVAEVLNLAPERTLIYEDIPYRRLSRVVPERLQQLREIGVSLTAPASLAVPKETKKKILLTYHSQLSALDIDSVIDINDALESETYRRPTVRKSGAGFR